MLKALSQWVSSISKDGDFSTWAGPCSRAGPFPSWASWALARAVRMVLSLAFSEANKTTPLALPHVPFAAPSHLHHLPLGHGTMSMVLLCKGPEPDPVLQVQSWLKAGQIQRSSIAFHLSCPPSRAVFKMSCQGETSKTRMFLHFAVF